MNQTLRKITYTFAGNDKKSGNIRQVKVTSNSIHYAERLAFARLLNPRLMSHSS